MKRKVLSIMIILIMLIGILPNTLHAASCGCGAYFNVNLNDELIKVGTPFSPGKENFVEYKDSVSNIYEMQMEVIGDVTINVGNNSGWEAKLMGANRRVYSFQDNWYWNLNISKIKNALKQVTINAKQVGEVTIKLTSFCWKNNPHETKYNSTAKVNFVNPPTATLEVKQVLQREATVEITMTELNNTKYLEYGYQVKPEYQASWPRARYVGRIELNTNDPSEVAPLSFRVPSLESGVSYLIRGYVRNIDLDGLPSETNIMTMKYGPPMINSLSAGNITAPLEGGKARDITASLTFTNKSTNESGQTIDSKLDCTLQFTRDSGISNPQWEDVETQNIVFSKITNKNIVFNVTVPSIDTSKAAYRLKAVDPITGYEINRVTSSFIIDSTPPSAPTVDIKAHIDDTTLTSVSSGYVGNKNITVTASGSTDTGGSGIDSYKFSYSHNSTTDYTPWVNGINQTFSKDGVYYVKFKTMDKSGKDSVEVGPVMFTIMKKAPSVPNVVLQRYAPNTAGAPAKIYQSYDNRAYTDVPVYAFVGALNPAEDLTNIKYEISTDGGVVWEAFAKTATDPDASLQGPITAIDYTGDGLPHPVSYKTYSKIADLGYIRFMMRSVDQFGNTSVPTDMIEVRINKSIDMSVDIDHKQLELALAVGNTKLNVAALTGQLKNSIAKDINSQNTKLAKEEPALLASVMAHTCTWIDKECSGLCLDNNCPYRTSKKVYTPQMVNVQGLQTSTVTNETKFKWKTYSHNSLVGAQVVESINGRMGIFVDGNQGSPESSPGKWDVWVGADPSGNSNNTKRRASHFVDISAAHDMTTLAAFGYYTTPKRDFMFLDNAMPTEKEIKFTINEGLVFRHTYDGGGFFFNTVVKGNKVSGYALYNGKYVLSGDQATNQLSTMILKFTDMPLIDFMDATGAQANDMAALFGAGLGLHPGNGYIKKIAEVAYDKTQTIKNYKLVADPDKVTIYMVPGEGKHTDAAFENAPILVSVPNLERVLLNGVEEPAFGFGPLSAMSTTGHNCTRDSMAVFSNISMKMGVVKNISEVVTEPKWGTGQTKYLLNVNDTTISDFTDPQIRAAISNRLYTDDVYYLGWGSASGNKAETVTFLNLINEEGVFVARDDGTTFDKQINILSEFIASRYYKSFAKNEVDDIIDSEESKIIDIDKAKNMILKVTPEEYNTNTADRDFPDGKWYLKHDIGGFANDLGIDLNNHKFQSDLNVKLDKVGRYRMYYAPDKKNLDKLDEIDEATGKPFIKPIFDYTVQRLPVAKFKVTVNKTTQKLDLINQSYDKDAADDTINMGITATEWAVVNTNDINPKIIFSTKMPTYADIANPSVYDIHIRVQDKYSYIDPNKNEKEHETDESTDMSEWSTVKSTVITGGRELSNPTPSFELNTVEVYDTATVLNDFIIITRTSTQSEGAAIEPTWKISGKNPTYLPVAAGEIIPTNRPDEYKITKATIEKYADAKGEIFLRLVETIVGEAAKTGEINKVMKIVPDIAGPSTPTITLKRVSKTNPSIVLPYQTETWADATKYNIVLDLSDSVDLNGKVLGYKLGRYVKTTDPNDPSKVTYTTSNWETVPIQNFTTDASGRPTGTISNIYSGDGEYNIAVASYDNKTGTPNQSDIKYIPKIKLTSKAPTGQKIEILDLADKEVEQNGYTNEGVRIKFKAINTGNIGEIKYKYSIKKNGVTLHEAVTVDGVVYEIIGNDIEGRYSVDMVAENEAGMQTPHAVNDFIIDGKAPTAPILEYGEGINGIQRSIIIQASGVSDENTVYYEYSINNGATWKKSEPNLTNYSVIVDQTGLFDILVRGIDVAGNISATMPKNGAIKVEIDATPPNPIKDMRTLSDTPEQIKVFSSTSDDLIGMFDKDGKGNPYRVSVDGGKTFTEIPQSTGNFTVNGLKPNIAYQVVVRASDLLGNARESDKVEQYTQAETPGIKEIQDTKEPGTNKSVYVYVDTKRNPSKTKYRINYSKGEFGSQEAVHTTAFVELDSLGRIRIRNLEAGFKYYMGVEAVNFAGEETGFDKAEVKSIEMTPISPPLDIITSIEVPAISANNATGYAILKWKEEKEQYVTKYVIFRDGVEIAETNQTEYTDLTIKADAEHIYTIAYKNNAGIGSPGGARTAYTYPLYPKGIQITDANNGNLKISMIPHENTQAGRKTRYSAYLTKEGDTNKVHIASDIALGAPIEFLGINADERYDLYITGVSSTDTGNDVHGNTKEKTLLLSQTTIDKPIATGIQLNAKPHIRIDMDNIATTKNMTIDRQTAAANANIKVAYKAWDANEGYGTLTISMGTGAQAKVIKTETIALPKTEPSTYSIATFSGLTIDTGKYDKIVLTINDKKPGEVSGQTESAENTSDKLLGLIVNKEIPRITFTNVPGITKFEIGESIVIPQPTLSVDNTILGYTPTLAVDQTKLTGNTNKVGKYEIIYTASYGTNKSMDTKIIQICETSKIEFGADAASKVVGSDYYTTAIEAVSTGKNDEFTKTGVVISPTVNTAGNPMSVADLSATANRLRDIEIGKMVTGERKKVEAQLEAKIVATPYFAWVYYENNGVRTYNITPEPFTTPIDDTLSGSVKISFSDEKYEFNEPTNGITNTETINIMRRGNSTQPVTVRVSINKTGPATGRIELLNDTITISSGGRYKEAQIGFKITGDGLDNSEWTTDSFTSGDILASITLTPVPTPSQDIVIQYPQQAELKVIDTNENKEEKRIILDKTEHIFAPLDADYSVAETLAVEIRNGGKSDLKNIVVSIIGDGAAAFSVSKEIVPNYIDLDNKMVRTFEVSPAPGVTYGTYHAIIQVSADGMEKPMEIPISVIIGGAIIEGRVTPIIKESAKDGTVVVRKAEVKLYPEGTTYNEITKEYSMKPSYELITDKFGGYTMKHIMDGRYMMVIIKQGQVQYNAVRMGITDVVINGQNIPMKLRTVLYQGDINQDGKVTVDDRTKLAEYYAVVFNKDLDVYDDGITTDQYEAIIRDLDGDGVITFVDRNEVLKSITQEYSYTLYDYSGPK